MTSIPLSIVNLRTKRETAIAANQVYINKNPDFQREYEAWDDKLKTRFIETMLIGRAMNPIWTIDNPEDESEEILDGMHRISTALDYLNNKFEINEKYLTCLDSSYKKKKFENLSPDDKTKLRNYNFTFNLLDSSYRSDVNKRRDMYEILNRSSRTLNDFEFNKVLYYPFYEYISGFKEQFNVFFNKRNCRGEIESEIIDMLILSEDLPNSWGSINVLRKNWNDKTLGSTEESVKIFMSEKISSIKSKIDFSLKIIQFFNEKNIFSKNKKLFNKLYFVYKCLICRSVFKFSDNSTFNKYKNIIIPIFEKEFLTIDIQEKLNCLSRNALFQRKLICCIDHNIDIVYNPKLPENRRFFSKSEQNTKLIEQGNVCNKCKKAKDKYESDHIIEWSKGGLTTMENLQVLCIPCHQNKYM